MGEADAPNEQTLWKATLSEDMSTDVPAQKVAARSQARLDQSLQTKGSRFLQASMSLSLATIDQRNGRLLEV